MSTANQAPNARPPTPGVSADGRPVIIVNKELREVSRDALRVLDEANSPPVLFMQGGRPARLCRDEKGRPSVSAVGPDELRHHMAQVADYARLLQSGRTTSTYPPLEVARDVLAMASLPFPALEGVTEVPILRRDGTVLTAAGYDPETRFVYEPDPGLEMPPIAEHPKAEEVQRARQLVEEILTDFPFVDAASRANAWAAVMSPIIRPAIGGQVPLAAIDAPTQGTGKTHLVKAVSVLATGREPAVMTEARDSEEWRKRLTAALREAPAIILLDNLEQALRSHHLAAVLSTSEWKDRELRYSRTVTLPQRSVWFATGNNLAVGGDMLRRVYWVRMDARVDNPEERPFSKPDLLGWVRERRGELLAALLTLTRAWAVAGKPGPAAGTPALAGFDEWRGVVGGVLRVAGVAGFLANREAARKRVDVDTEGFGRFLEAWHRNYGSDAVPLTAATQSLEVMENLPPQLDPDERGFRRKFGWLLRRNAERRFGPLRIERAGESKGGALWTVVSGEEAAGPRLVSGAEAAL